MQFDQLKRRELVALLGGAAAMPFAARAQQGAMPVIGFISGGSRDTYVELLAPFRQGLKETGYVDGQTVAIESRWADGQLDRLPRLAADLVQRRIAVVVATGDSSSRAAKAASSTIPLVFLTRKSAQNVWRCSRKWCLGCRERRFSGTRTTPHSHSLGKRRRVRLPHWE
jgi:ABC-type uncharacterized transport system substrate-binding protein